jgi:hypothetical protein
VASKGNDIVISISVGGNFTSLESANAVAVEIAGIIAERYSHLDVSVETRVKRTGPLDIESMGIRHGFMGGGGRPT